MDDNISFDKMAEDFLANNGADNTDFMDLITDDPEGEIAAESRMYIIQLEDRSHLGDEIEDYEIDFCFECLESEHLLLATQAAVFLVSHSKETILRVVDNFTRFNDVLQKFIIVLLVGTEFVEVYVFLLTLLKDGCDKSTAGLIVEALSKTDYFIFPLLMVRLDDTDPIFREYVLSVLEKMGFKKVEPFLAMFPYLPHERDFRKIYGNTNIDSLYK